MEKRFKGGYLDPITGLVFCHYNKRLKSGEYWVTPEHYKERVDKRKQKHLERWDNDLDYKNRLNKRCKSSKSKEKESERKKTDVFKQKRKKYISSWYANKYKNNSLFVLKARLRARIAWAFNQKKSHKTKETQKYIGTDWETCEKFIESQFLDGMNWNNKHLWHIDHFFPISIAKSYQQLKQLLYFTNLRPMWAIDNIRKSCSLPAIDDIIKRDEFLTRWIKTKYSLS